MIKPRRKAVCLFGFLCPCPSGWTVVGASWSWNTASSNVREVCSLHSLRAHSQAALGALKSVIGRWDDSNYRHKRGLITTGMRIVPKLDHWPLESPNLWSIQRQPESSVSSWCNQRNRDGEIEMGKEIGNERERERERLGLLVFEQGCLSQCYAQESAEIALPETSNFTNIHFLYTLRFLDRVCVTRSIPLFVQICGLYANQVGRQQKGCSLISYIVHRISYLEWTELV